MFWTKLTRLSVENGGSSENITERGLSISQSSTFLKILKET